VTTGGTVLLQDGLVELGSPVHVAPDDHCQRDGIVTLQGSSTGLVLKLTPTANDFGTVPVGTTSPAFDFVVMNIAPTATVNVFAVVTGDFVLPDAPCGPVGPGGQCPVRVAFRPIGAGARTGTLTIQASVGSILQANLAGTGVLPDAATD
jgi:hypothetical protein